MDRIEKLLNRVSALPDSQLQVSYRDCRAQIDLGAGRGQTVFIERGDSYVLNVRRVGRCQNRTANRRYSLLRRHHMAA
jgi:hypothetical protein